MTEKLLNYDPASALDSSEAISVFMADAFETENTAYIAKALGVVARVKDMAEISRETGLSHDNDRNSLRILSQKP